MEEQNKEQHELKGENKEKFNFGKFHDKYYKFFLLIPIFFLAFSLVYMSIFYSENKDFIKKDISLTGGTTVTLTGNLTSAKITQDLSSKLNDLNTREIYDLITRKQKALILETKSSPEETKQVLETYLGYELDETNSSFEFTGASLSGDFYKQLLIALIFAFVFMAIVIFIIFVNFVPSMAVIISAFADILMTLVVINLLGMKVSSAGIVALLMLIGYSVDTDILLTNRVLKRSDNPLNTRLWGAFKTGITMTLTSLFAVFSALIITGSVSVVLSQIFTILSIGLCFDIFNTWVTNVSILKGYMEARK
jgi:preprotein translocase subunit SecF